MELTVVVDPDRTYAGIAAQDAALRLYDHLGVGRVRWYVEGDPGLSLLLSLAPLKLSSAGLADEYETVRVPGEPPRLVRRSEGLHVMSGDLTLIHRYPGYDVERQLAELRAMARGRGRIWTDYGPSEMGWWRLTSLGWTVVDRTPDDRIKEATAAFELTRAWHPDASLVPPAEQARRAGARAGRV